jgi:protein involved in polysaccharide export with SLBB domain
MSEKGSQVRNENVAECYLVHCPDVLALRVTNRRDLTGTRTVGPDGRIDLGPYGRLRVQGRSTAECARLIAREAGIAPARVRVQVAEYRSQQIYLFGQVNGLQRAVPYQGPETVLDLLQRTGGITKGAAPNDVFVVRSHIADNRRPEAYHIHLHDILVNQNQNTNLRLQPFDQVYIGQTRSSSLSKSIPAAFRPLYNALCGIRPSWIDFAKTERSEW